MHHFAGSIAKIPGIGQTGYIAVTALVLNLAVAIVLTIILRFVPRTVGPDRTAPGDYLVDKDTERLEVVPRLGGASDCLIWSAFHVY